MSGRLGMDERVIEWRDRLVGYLGPKASTFTLGWLASHRGRLRSLILGGHRLSVLVVWDAKGQAPAGRSEDDVAAIATLVYGERQASRIDRAPELIERLASAAFESDTRGGHHHGGPWTWHMIGDDGRANYRRLAHDVLDELEGIRRGAAAS